jgi:putative acetyltransferase
VDVSPQNIHPDLIISEAASAEELEAIRALFREYASRLGVDLCFQNFEAELRSLPGAYSRPRGRLLIARVEGQVAGCIALRPLDEVSCEMKRLYVRPQFRRLRVGKSLAQQIVEEARKIGYATMRLDTLDSMAPALRLYESLGFERCGAYYETPLANTVFMELRLR